MVKYFDYVDSKTHMLCNEIVSVDKSIRIFGRDEIFKYCPVFGLGLGLY